MSRMFKTTRYQVLDEDTVRTNFDPDDPRGYPYLAKFTVQYSSLFGEQKSDIEFACNREGYVVEMVKGFSENP